MAIDIEQSYIDMAEFEEREEGFPTLAPGLYLGKVTRAEPDDTRAGIPFLPYEVTILEPSVDKNNVQARGTKVRNALFFMPNPTDREGNLRSDEQIQSAKRGMLGTVRSVVRTVSGEDFSPSGSVREIVEEAAGQIMGSRVVVRLSVQKSDEYGDRNVIRKHISEDDWQGDED